MRLLGKNVIITGASRGLGRALAKRFAAEGANLGLCARNAVQLDQLREELSPVGVKIRIASVDIASSSEVQGFMEGMFTEFGKIDTLINNASRLGPRVPIVDYPLSEWDETIQTNINGLFFATKFVLPFMINEKQGAIINVSSSVGKTGRAKWGAYSISKFAMEGFSQILAEELKQFNVSVNTVNPGPMATEMRKAAYPHEDQSLLRTPEQLTEVFVYLASNDGRGISGQSFDASTYIANPR